MAMKAITDASKKYHRSAMTRMRELLARYRDPCQSVGTMLDTQAQRVMDNNQKVIESLFKIIILCGKQGLAMHGHRDDRVQWEEEDEGSNKGNFVQLVRFAQRQAKFWLIILPSVRRILAAHLKPFRMSWWEL
ncbi:52 kDa repressor of the inhibitor of the protein kinase [Oopsacas minuta]|uniref:52 kDa repressor of the inhibitor of the protein kinase n=1 Tax=Oopsacas minuta TaxID=111878 RepID=A0AAV7JUM8_9METZ|nr:52 kDa repressor of the inhibitor of the protein kinase [Oopsacas minuta]